MQHAQFFSKASVFALTLGMLLMSGDAFSQEIQMNPATPPPHLNQLKEDRKIKFIERIDTPGTGFIKTLGIIDRILKHDTLELPAVIWSDLTLPQSYFLHEALRIDVDDSMEWKRLKYYGFKVSDPNGANFDPSGDEDFDSYGDYYVSLFDSIEKWKRSKSAVQQNRLNQITILSERNEAPSYINEYGSADFNMWQTLGMWMHYFEKNGYHKPSKSLTAASLTEAQIHYESLRAYWISSLFEDSASFYAETNGETTYGVDASFDPISAFYKFVLLNPFNIDLNWRDKKSLGWNRYREIQMYEYSCKMASNTSKLGEISLKIENELLESAAYKRLIKQSENEKTFSNLELSKRWIALKSNNELSATVYIVLRDLDYNLNDIPSEIPYGMLVNKYFSEVPFAVWAVNPVTEKMQEFQSGTGLVWVEFDVLDIEKNRKIVDRYTMEGGDLRWGKTDNKSNSDSTLNPEWLARNAAPADSAFAVGSEGNTTDVTPVVDLDYGTRNQTQWGIGVSYLQVFKSQNALSTGLNKTLNAYGVGSVTQLNSAGFEVWMTPGSSMTGFSYLVNNGLVSGLREELKTPAQYTSRYIGFSSGAAYKRRFFELGSGGTYGHITQRVVLPLSATGSYIFNAKRTDVIEHKSFVYGIYIESKLKLKYLYIKAHGGYQFDFANSRWQYRDQYINSSDRLTLSGFYASISAGILINQK